MARTLDFQSNKVGSEPTRAILGKCRCCIMVVPKSSKLEVRVQFPLATFVGVIQSVECHVANVDVVGSYPITNFGS